MPTFVTTSMMISTLAENNSDGKFLDVITQGTGESVLMSEIIKVKMWYLKQYCELNF